MGDMADHIEWAELPDESVHEPTSDNPSPSKGLIKATQPDIDTQIEEILEEYFVMRAARPTDDLAILKLRNESGSPERELAEAIKTLLIQSKIDELEKQADYISGFRFRNLPSRDTGRFGTKDFKVEAQLLIEAKQRIARILTDRISKLKEEL